MNTVTDVDNSNSVLHDEGHRFEGHDKGYQCFAGIKRVKVKEGLRLFSDNAPCYVSCDLKQNLDLEGMSHTRGRPYRPMTQGKIDRYHRSMKNIILLDHYYTPKVF